MGLKAGTEQGIRPKRSAFAPPDAGKADVAAIKAVFAGTANADQQRRAMRFIVYGLAATYDWAYRPSSVNDTHVMLGRQFVGQQLVAINNRGGSSDSESGG